MSASFSSLLAEHQRVLAATASSCAEAVEVAGQMVVDALASGHKVLLCGNGGSAADCQHMAAEIVGRFETERRGWPAIALTTDSSALTALGNDYGYEQVFARQVAALASPGDVLWAYSTSGRSANILRACEVAKQRGCQVLALTGAGPNPLSKMADVALCVPSANTARTQEVHLFLGHVLCSLIDAALSDGG